MEGINNMVNEENDRFDFDRNQSEFDDGSTQFNQGDMEDVMLALEAALIGELPQAEAAQVIDQFIAVFGEEEFKRASQAILGGGQGMDVPMGPDSGLVEGPGTGTSDSVDAMIMPGPQAGYAMGGQVDLSKLPGGGAPEPVKLSAGEYILPHNAVSQIGGGDHGLGTIKLDKMLGKEIGRNG